MAALLPSAHLVVLSQLNSRFNTLDLIGRICRDFLLGFGAEWSAIPRRRAAVLWFRVIFLVNEFSLQSCKTIDK
jgi:hypothetical protein